jgi:hypothetical protein
MVPPSLQPTDTGQMDVSQLLEDAEVAVAPGSTVVPPRAAPEPEPQPDTIFDVEVIDDEGAGEAPQAQPFAAAPRPSGPKPREASETFMVPQDSLEEAPDGGAEFGDADMNGLDSLDDDEGLSVDGTDMSDVSDLLDELDEE